MEKIYPQVVVKSANDIHESFKESKDLYANYDEYSLSVAKEVILENLLEKFLNNEFDDNLPVFNEESFGKLINEISAIVSLKNLEKAGLINHYIDDNDEEIYFLTELGKKFAESIK